MIDPRNIPNPSPAEFAIWRLTHPPVMGGAAPGAPAPPAPTGGASNGVQPQTGAQAPAGQGDVDHLAGLYDLSTAPEALRPHLEQELRKINAGLAGRFQEHSELQQRLEPLSKVEGLTDVHPEDLQELMGFYTAVAAAADETNPNDENLYQWWEELGNRFDFFGNGDGEPGSEPGEPGPEAEGPPAWAQPLMQELQELRQWRDQQEHQANVQSIDKQVETGLKQLAEKHKLDEDAQTAVVQLMAAYGQLPVDQALQSAVADYFRISGKAEAGLLQESGTPPGPTTPAGGQVPAPGADGPMRLGDKRLKQAALARLQGTNAGAAA